MYLHKEDLEKMLEILKSFPEVETVEVKQDNSSGIGSHTTMVVRTTVNNVSGEFEVTVSSVENW
jgi:uncharacterized protein YlxP (DUF503 family)